MRFGTVAYQFLLIKSLFIRNGPPHSSELAHLGRIFSSHFGGGLACFENEAPFGAVFNFHSINVFIFLKYTLCFM